MCSTALQQARSPCPPVVPTVRSIMARSMTPQLDLVRDQAREFLENNPVAKRVAQDSFDRVVELFRPHADYVRVEEAKLPSFTDRIERYKAEIKIENMAPDNPLKRGRFYYYKEAEPGNRHETNVLNGAEEDNDDRKLGIFWLVGCADNNNPRPFIPKPEEHDTDSLWCWYERLDPKSLELLDVTVLFSNDEFNELELDQDYAKAAKDYLYWLKGSVADKTPVSGQAYQVISAPENLAKPPAPPAGAEAIDEYDVALLAFLNQTPNMRRKVSDVMPVKGPQDRKAVSNRLRKLADQIPPLVDYPKGGRTGVAILVAGVDALKRVTAPTPH